jgi:hypothetical protein
MSISRFSIYWNAQNSDLYTGTPVRQRTRNDLDSHGTFLDLARLANESNTSYYKRLQSVIPLRGGADYNGLIHGVTRELGLEEKIGVKISPVSSGGRWTATSPFVRITASNIILYSSYTDSDTYTIDKTINIFDHGTGYLLEDIISEIQSSEYFVAELGSSMTGKEKSNGLFAGYSAKIISKELVPANNFFLLDYTDIIPQSLYFTEKEIFNTELSTNLASSLTDGFTLTWAVSTTVTNDGDYFVDYDTGAVNVKNLASGRGTCRYIYRDFPWYVRWSPVAVYSLRDSNYRTKVFENETMLDNSVQDGLVTAEGVKVYSQIFEKSHCLWGE